MVIRDWRKERDAREIANARKEAEKESKTVRQAELMQRFGNHSRLRRRSVGRKRLKPLSLNSAGLRPASALEETSFNSTADASRKAFVRDSADRNLLQENVELPGGEGEGTRHRRTRTSL